MKAIILPGNGGCTADSHWYKSVKSDLKTLGIEVVSETMPDPVLARKTIWLPFIKEHAPADNKLILIGHSSGAVAALRYAETQKVTGIVLVGAHYTDLGSEDEKKSGYFDDPWNWEAIQANAGFIIQFASPDDPYIPAEHSRFIAKHTQSQYHELPNRGHFMNDTLPELIEALKPKLVAKTI